MRFLSFCILLLSSAGITSAQANYLYGGIGIDAPAMTKLHQHFGIRLGLGNSNIFHFRADALFSQKKYNYSYHSANDYSYVYTTTGFGAGIDFNINLIPKLNIVIGLSGYATNISANLKTDHQHLKSILANNAHKSGSSYTFNGMLNYDITPHSGVYLQIQVNNQGKHLDILAPAYFTFGYQLKWSFKDKISRIKTNKKVFTLP